MIQLAQVLGAALLGVAFAWISILNWIALARQISRPNPPSWIPFVGAVLGVVAIFVEPTGVLRPYWWMPFLIDGGSVPGLFATGVQHGSQAFPKRPRGADREREHEHTPPE